MTMDSTGLTVKTLAEIRADIQAALRASLGDGIQLDGSTVLGKIVDLVASREASANELLRQAYDSLHIESAAGTALDDLMALRGITRLPATFSTVTLEFTGSEGATIPAGSLARAPNGPTFATDEEAVIGVSLSVTVGTTCTTTGPIEALADTITQLVSSIPSVTAVNNPADALKGRDAETDSALRTRSGTPQHAGSVDSIRAHVLAAIGGLCAVNTNRTDAVDANGLPPHSVQVVVFPAPNGDEDALAERLFHVIPAGIYIEGANEVTVFDTNLLPHTVRYDVATEVPLYVKATVTKQVGFYAGDDILKAALVAAFDGIGIGGTVYHASLVAAAMSVQGVLDAVIWVDDVLPLTDADVVNISADPLEVPTLSTTDIEVAYG